MGDPGDAPTSRGLADRIGVDVVDATCSVNGCATKPKARGWCDKHYQRWKVHGDPAYTSPFTDRRSHAGKVCSVEGCERPRRKRTWCANHYTHWRNHGDAGATYSFKWSAEKRCVVCGATDWPGPRRKFCSGACQQLHSRHDGDIPTTADCVLCIASIDLTERGKAGRRKRADTMLCDRCKRRRGLRHKTSIMVIVNRDGTDCGICSEPVDMALDHPHPDSASLDHIVPRARGGSDDPSNLQVAHLTCNLKKHTSTTV